MTDLLHPQFGARPEFDPTYIPSDVQLPGCDLESLVSASPFERMNAICNSFTQEWERSRPDLVCYIRQVAPNERPALLRNLLEFEIRNRREAGAAPKAKDYLDRLPVEYADLVRRVFLDSSSVSMASRWEPTPAQGQASVRAPAASRLGDYRLVRELGRGGMGAVFEAVHLGRGYRVALKTLPAVSGESLHRFKREFRSLADVTHPNLIGLRTLECDGAQWFITMDLLEGCDFLSYVRPGEQLDESRLTAGLAQLAMGVMALHAKGIVHRDLKPANVIVTTRGQVVILDFGLVAELSRVGSITSAAGAGTPAYMSPEQASGDAVGTASDWYAVGVMLYEALTGSRPFNGDLFQLINAKRYQDAPRLPEIPTIPAHLSELCSQLLARDPASRPDPLKITSVIVSAVPSTTGKLGGADQLIARETQLAALGEVLAAFRRTRDPVTAFIQGRSGEGKTSLAECFLSDLRRDSSLVVMSGRCYDRESVPFKALDTLVDALVSYLKSLSPTDAALLLPDDIGLLAEVFPVLRRCEVVAKSHKGRLDALDQQQIRQRAFAALRMILDRIGERTPLVWFIDDLQWGDADSAGALFEVLRPQTAPPLLFLGTYRSDEADTSPFLTEWSNRQKQNGVRFSDRVVAVGPLTLDQATQLVVNVVARDDELVRRRAVQFHAQAGGNPFLLVELAGCFDPDADAFHATDIHSVLARKLDELPLEAGPLLNAVSVSGQAVELSEAAAAVGLTDSPEGALTRMRNMRLLRVVGAKVDTYHDRIRYAVLERMDVEHRRTMHRKLGEVIEKTVGGLDANEIDAFAEGRDDPASKASLHRVYDLAYHFDAAGDTKLALAYALLAARQARSQSAVDVVAQQYAIAQRNAGTAPKLVRFRIGRGIGEALMLLGRYDEAKIELESATALAERSFDVADVSGVRGELASQMGLIAESIERFEEGLRQLDIRVPRTRLGLCCAVIKETFVQVAHCCLPLRLNRGSPDAKSDLANHLLARLEWSLYCNNVLNLVWASLLGLNRAEMLPRSKALAINYIVHANDMAVLGWHSRAKKYYEMAIELSKELNDQWAAALGLSHSALGCIGAGQYELAITKAEPGKAAFTRLGDLFELQGTYLFLAMAHYGLGNLVESLDHTKWLFESCVRHGEHYVAAWAAFYLSRISRGRLPVDELLSCVKVLPGNNLSAATALMAEGYWHTHHGRTAEALAAFEQAWQICQTNTYVVTFNSNVLCELVTALRLHAEALDRQKSPEADRVWRRTWKMAKWASRLSWLLPAERPHSLRELSLVYAHLGFIKHAWNLARLSCQKAKALKARYEHAKSLLIQGRMAQRLGLPESADQISQASTEIELIEETVNTALAARNR